MGTIASLLKKISISCDANIYMECDGDGKKIDLEHIIKQYQPMRKPWQLLIKKYWLDSAALEDDLGIVEDALDDGRDLGLYICNKQFDWDSFCNISSSRDRKNYYNCNENLYARFVCSDVEQNLGIYDGLSDYAKDLIDLYSSNGFDVIIQESRMKKLYSSWCDTTQDRS